MNEIEVVADLIEFLEAHVQYTVQDYSGQTVSVLTLDGKQFKIMVQECSNEDGPVQEDPINVI